MVRVFVVGGGDRRGSEVVGRARAKGSQQQQTKCEARGEGRREGTLHTGRNRAVGNCRAAGRAKRGGKRRPGLLVRVAFLPRCFRRAQKSRGCSCCPTLTLSSYSASSWVAFALSPPCRYARQFTRPRRGAPFSRFYAVAGEYIRADGGFGTERSYCCGPRQER